MRVLVAEDLWVLADALKLAIEQAGAEVVGPAGTVAAAERLSREMKLDAAVMDVDLHGAKSTALALTLAAAGLKVIIITGYDEPPDVAAQVHACFTKPEQPSELISALARPSGRR
jgi:CheY-like chemotaxis protein